MEMNILLLVYDCLRKDYWLNDMLRAQEIVSQPGWVHFKNHWAVAHCSDPNFSTLLGGQPPWITGITTQMGTGYRKTSPYQLNQLLGKTGYYLWSMQPIGVPSFYHQFYEIAWQKTEESADLELNVLRQHVEAGHGQWFGFIRDMTTHYPYNNLPCPPRGSGNVKIQYAEAVDHVDRHFQNVVEYVLDKEPNTAILVMADHGELLGEHGGLWDHLYTLYNYLVSVPMAMYLPDNQNPAMDFYGRTQHIDVYSTILNLAGVRVPKGFLGQSLVDAPFQKPSKRSFNFKNRTLRFQGTGAGPVEGENFVGLDSGKALWRHTGVIHGNVKLVMDYLPEGHYRTVLTRPEDYSEKTTLMEDSLPRRIYKELPEVPNYSGLVSAQIQAEYEQTILSRLEALGYA